MNPMKLCIPKVSNQTSTNQIFRTFSSLNIGKVKRIIENPLRANQDFKRIVISIDWDNSNPLSNHIQNTLKDPTQHINIVYDMPLFWQIFAANPQKW